MGNSKIKNLQEQNAALRDKLELVTSQRDNWEITAYERRKALSEANEQLKGKERMLDGAKGQLRAIERKAENEKREKHLAELREGIVRLCCAEVTVSKKNDGESWVTVEFLADAEELSAVEEFLEGEAEPKLGPVPGVGEFIQKCEALKRALATNFVSPLTYVAGRL